MIEAQQSIEQLPELTCPRLNKARMICVSPKCKQSAMICFQEDCQLCQKNHDLCEYYRIHSLIKQIRAKRQSITPEIEEAIKTMEKIYDQAIERLSEDKESLRDQMELFGYNQYEAKLIRMLEDGLSADVKGKLAYDIVQNLPIQCEFLATAESVQKFWDRKKKDFNELFDKFKKITGKKYKRLQSAVTEDVQFIESLFQSKALGQFKLLFRASENNFSTARFHQVCDGKKNTLVLALTEYGKIVGGFNPFAWASNGQYNKDNGRQTFIFSVSLHEKYQITNTNYGAYNQAGYGPTFGGGHDLYISDNAHMNNNAAYCNFGHSYNLNGKYQTGAASYAAFSGSTTGQFYCKIKQWQVFEIEME